MFKSIIRLIKNTKKNNKEKINEENNSANEGVEKLHAITHIFIHGHWF